MGYTKQCCERSEQKICGFLPQIVTFLRYISRKWSQKNCGIYLFWRQKVRVPSYLGAWPKVGDKLYYGPPSEILGTRPPHFSNQIYATKHDTPYNHRWISLFLFLNLILKRKLEDDKHWTSPAMEYAMDRQARSERCSLVTRPAMDQTSLYLYESLLKYLGTQKFIHSLKAILTPLLGLSKPIVGQNRQTRLWTKQNNCLTYERTRVFSWVNLVLWRCPAVC